MKKKLFSSLLALVLLLTLGLVTAVPVSAATHAVTPGASVDIDADENGGAYVALNDIVFTDLPGTDLSDTDTFYLTAPTGFEFNPAATADEAVGAGYGTTQIDLGTGAGTAQAPTYSGSDTIATWTVTAAGVGTVGSITISGMEIRPTAATTVIVGDGTANVTIAGSATTFDTADAHPIDHVPGVHDAFTVVTENAGTETAGVGFTITLEAIDQYGNVNDDGANLVTGATGITWTSTATAAPDGTDPTPISDGDQTFALGVATTGADWTLTNAGETPTITADLTSDGTVDGTSAALTVNNAAHAAYTVDPDGLIQTAGTAFNVTMTAVDEFENAATVPDIDATLNGYAFILWGPSYAPDGTAPTVEMGAFASGVSTLSLTLAKVETVALTVTDDQTVSMSGTSATVFVGGINLNSEGYRTGATVTVTVGDEALATAGTTGIVASGDIPADDVEVALTETPADSGIFIGTFTLVDTSPGPGQLLVGEGSTITVTYPTDHGLEVWPLNEATVDNVSPVFVSVAGGACYKDTDEITLEVELDFAGYTVTADFSSIDSEYTSGVEETTGGPVYIVTYTISADNTKLDGGYVIPVTATDVAGNSTTDSSFFTTLDNTEPAVTNEVPGDGSFIGDPTPLFSVEVTDSSIDYGAWTMVIDSPVGDVTADLSITPITGGYLLEYLVPSANALDEGTYTWTVTATDLAGNVGTAEFSFTYDATAPELDAAQTGMTWDAVGEVPEDTNSRTTIMATFSEPLDEATVAGSDFLVAGSETPSAAVVHGAEVFLTITEMATGATPSVELVGEVSDIAGNAQTEGEIEEAEDWINPVLALVVDPLLGMHETEITITVTSSEALDGLPTVWVRDSEETLVDLDDPGMVAIDTTTWEGTYTIDDTTDAEGTYDVGATGTDLNGNTPDEVLAGAFDGDFTAPSVTFTPVDGAQVATTSTWITIEFDEDVELLLVTFDEVDVTEELYPTDEGQDIYMLATTDLEMGDHTISVLAADLVGNEMAAPETATFTVVVATESIELFPGWNLTSIPIIPDDPDIEIVLGEVTVDSVWAYEPTYLTDGIDNNEDGRIDEPEEAWLSYSPGEPSDLTEMKDGVGYWVRMSAPATLSVTGIIMPEPPSLPPTYSVVAGWNLIGFKSTATMTADEYLAATTLYAVVWGYGVGGYSSVGGGEDLNPGQGYWVWFNEPGTIVPPGQ